MHGRSLYVAACAALLAGCGYQGDPQPPSLQIPVAITDLKAVERGSKIIVDFTIPKKSTDNLDLKGEPYLELHVGERKLRVRAAELTAHVEVEAAPFYSQTIKVGVKVENDRGRDAGWSNIVDLDVQPALAMPEELKAVAVPKGVQLTWRSAERQFVVFRQGPDDAALVRLGTADARTYTDETAEFGKHYRYAVQTVKPPAESDRTAPFEITLKDEFAPAVPANVAAVVGPASIELVWDRVTDSNLAGYRVYRDDKRIGETGPGPSFSDRKIEAGKRYRYTVTSFSKAGIESAPSQPTETK